MVNRKRPIVGYSSVGKTHRVIFSSTGNIPRAKVKNFRSLENARDFAKKKADEYGVKAQRVGYRDAKGNKEFA